MGKTSVNYHVKIDHRQPKRRCLEAWGFLADSVDVLPIADVQACKASSRRKGFPKRCPKCDAIMEGRLLCPQMVTSKELQPSDLHHAG